jgi:hypothetical protein
MFVLFFLPGVGGEEPSSDADDDDMPGELRPREGKERACEIASRVLTSSSACRFGDRRIDIGWDDGAPRILQLTRVQQRRTSEKIEPSPEPSGTAGCGCR